ncbi:MAG: hypothetical protein ACLRW2_10585 [Parasutterella excrementihominis]
MDRYVRPVREGRRGRRLPELAAKFRGVGAIEKHHEERYLTLKQRQNAESFQKERNRYVAVRDAVTSLSAARS